MPVWEIEYSDEVKFYFLDNDPYTFALLVRIEELRYAADAIPPEGCTPLPGEPNHYLWLVLEHVVAYEKQGTTTLKIWVVKPLDDLLSLLTPD
jgi:hypothetical protein